MTPIARFKHRKSGIEYGIFDEGQGTYTVLAWYPGRLNDGVEIGRANLTDDGRGDYFTSVRVDREHQRRGVATALYKAVERATGRTLRPSPRHLSPDAEAFWKADKHRRRS